SPPSPPGGRRLCEPAMTSSTRVLPPYDPMYPDCDGEPIAATRAQYRYLTMTKGGLDAVFLTREDVLVAGDLFWYPVEGHPELRTAPDVLVALGRPKGERRSYQQWKEDD